MLFFLLFLVINLIDILFNGEVGGTKKTFRFNCYNFNGQSSIITEIELNVLTSDSVSQTCCKLPAIPVQDPFWSREMCCKLSAIPVEDQSQLTSHHVSSGHSPGKRFIAEDHDDTRS